VAWTGAKAGAAAVDALTAVELLLTNNDNTRRRKEGEVGL